MKISKPKGQISRNSSKVYLLKTKHDIINVSDKKDHYVQTCENAHPKNISESKTHSKNTTSAKNNPTKGTKTNIENTDLKDTTSHSEPNKTTEEKFPTPNTEDQWQNSIMTLQESQYFLNIEHHVF